MEIFFWLILGIIALVLKGILWLCEPRRLYYVYPIGTEPTRPALRPHDRTVRDDDDDTRW